MRSTTRRSSRIRRDSIPRRSAGAAILLAAVLAAPSARADAESDAKDLFARARDLRARNDCTDAVPVFRRALQVYPDGLGSLRNIAECEEQLGHYASSKRAWLDLKRALITTLQDPKYEGWDKDAQDAAMRLAAKITTIFVDVILKTPAGEAPANEGSGVEIVINGESIGTKLGGTPLERDPGNFRIRVTAQNAEPFEETLALTAGDSRHLIVRLVQAPTESGAELVTGKGKRTAGYLLLGVGAAAVLGSGVTFLVRSGARSDLDAQCPSHSGCDKSLQSTVDRGKLMSTLTTILFPLGLVAGGAGVGLVVWGNSAKEAAPRLRIMPGLGRLDASWGF